MAQQPPLGVRNNNPLNIRHYEENQWQGMAGTEKGFVKFSDESYGYRAADKILQSYSEQGINTLSGIISRFAPESENDTEGYINFVADSLSLDPNAEVDLTNPATRFSLLASMSKMETGTNIDPEQLGALVVKADEPPVRSSRGFADAFPVEESTQFEDIDPLSPVNPADEVLAAVQALPPKGAGVNINRKSLDLTVTKMALNPLGDPMMTYRESRDELESAYNPEAVLELYRQEYANTQKQAVVQSTVQAARLGQQSPEDAADTVSVLNDFNQEYSGELGQERIFAESLAPLSMDDFAVEAEIAKNYAWAKHQKFAEDLGTWDTVSSWLSSFFVPDATKDAADLVDGSMFTAKGDLVKLVQGYNSLDPRERPQAWDSIWNKAVEAYEGNHIKLAGLIELFHSVDPRKEFSAMQAMDAVDVATSATLGAIVKAVRGFIKGTNAANKAKRLQSPVDAAIMGDAPGVIEDKVTKANNRSPFELENEIPFMSSTDNISKEIMSMREQLKASIAADVRQPVRTIGSEDFIVKPRAISDANRTQAVLSREEELVKMAEERGVTYESIAPASINEDGFTLTYKWDGGRVTETRRWKDTDAGTFIEENPNFKANSTLKNALSRILSPDVMLRNVAPRLVKDVTVGGLQSSRVRNELIKVRRAIDEGMKKDEVIRVNELLVAGDEAERVFTLDELLSGNVEVKSGTRPYTMKEIENYYKKVAFSEELWAIKNATLRKELEFTGAKHVSFLFEGDAFPRELFGIPGKDFNTLPRDLPVNEKILAPQLGKSETILAKDLDRTSLAEQGFVPVRLVKPFMTRDGQKVRWAILKDEGKSGRVTFGQIPDEVLNRIPGYVPRVYQPGYHYVKSLENGETIRAFERKTDAERWIKERLKEDSSLRLDVFRDRDFDSYESFVEEANFYGGLITGGRKKSKPLLLNEKGERLARMSYGDSMNRYIDSISEEMPMNEYRMALKEKFINTVNALAKAEGKGKSFGIDPRADWKTAPINISDAAMKNSMEQLRQYMLNQFKIWTPRERSFNNFMMDIAEGSEGKWGALGNIVNRSAIHLAHKDPVKALRGATFHAHLGWFNPRHLYVQAQNASLAISMYPIKGVKAASKMLSQRALIFMNDAALENIKNTNKWGMGDLVDDVREFRRSGMIDSILRNADYDAAVEGITPGTMTNIRKASKAGLVFYENGELASRLIAWNIAKDNLGLAGKKLSDREIADVVEESFRLHMNLQRENAAWWQQNILAIPTQFMQVQAKFVENMMGAITGKGPWTKKEAASVFAGQIVLYGTMGVPMAEQATEYLMDLTGMTAEELQQEHPGLAEAIVDGINGYLGQMVGMDNQFGGDTASLLAGLDDNVVWGTIAAFKDAFTGRHNTETVGDVLLGPTLNTIGRSGDMMLNAAESMKAVFMKPTFENGAEGMVKFMDDFIAISSTWNNARKARELFRLKQVLSKNGNVMIGESHVKNMNLMTKLAQGMGFTTDIEASYYAQKRSNISRAEEVSFKKQAIKDALVQARKTGGLDRYQALMQWHLEGLYDIEREEIMDSLYKDVAGDQVKSEVDKEVARYLEQMIKGGGRHRSQLEHMHLMNSTENREDK